MKNHQKGAIRLVDPENIDEINWFTGKRSKSNLEKMTVLVVIESELGQIKNGLELAFMEEK